MTEVDGPDPIDVAVGRRVRALRRLRRLSQKRLASMVGVSFQQLCKYEQGLNRISASALVRVAAALASRVAVLVGEVDERAEALAARPDLAAPGVIDLLVAYSQIADERTRRAFLVAVRAAAAVTPGDDAGETRKA